MKTIDFTDSLPSKLSILLVEDNADDAELVTHHLGRWNHPEMKIIQCDSLKNTLVELRNEGIDLILLDLSLPDSQGIETVKKIRSCAPGVPIIVLSGRSDNEIALESLKHGAEDYFIKTDANANSLSRAANYAIARSKVHEMSDRLAAIVEASDDAIVGQTIEGVITSWNRGAEQLFGYTEKTMIGKSMSLLMPEGSESELAHKLHSIKNGNSIRGLETVRIDSRGKRLDVLATISPIVRDDGTITGLASIYRDISERKAAQKIVEESEERYRQLVAGVKDYAIFMLDPKGDVVTWNTGATKIMGYEAGEIIGKNFSVFYNDEEKKSGLPQSELVIASAEGTCENLGWRVRKDGTCFFADVTISRVLDDSGGIKGFVKITRDITDSRNAQEQIAEVRLRLNMALKAAEVGVWDYDMLQNTVTRSLKHDEIFGYSSLLSAWNFDIFLSHVVPEDQAAVKACFESGISESQFRMECRIRRVNDNSLRWIAARGETFRDEQGRPTRMMGTIVDFTDHQEQESQRRSLALMEEREEFMATLTHDMKNPLVAANRVLELMVTGSLGELSEQQLEILHCLKTSNTGLLKLIADLSDVYRFEKDVNILAIENCDLVSIVNSSVEQIRPFADLRAIKVSTQWPESLELQLDENRFMRVMQNLLDNALKFASQGGAVAVRVKCIDQIAVVEVEDNGPGIAESEQHLLFRRFSQGRAGKGYSGGTGLGLYFCKQVVDAHGGSIECDSEPGKYTIFKVRLPLQQSSPAGIDSGK